MNIEDASLLDAVGRMPRESARAWRALLDYAQMGPGRSLRKLEDAYRHVELGGGQVGAKGVPLSRLKKWSSKYEWGKRAAAWDAAVEGERARMWQERQALVDERDWEHGEEMRKVALKGLKALFEELENGGRLSPGEAARLVEVASKVQRLATGKPTERREERWPEMEKMLDRAYGGRSDEQQS